MMNTSNQSAAQTATILHAPIRQDAEKLGGSPTIGSQRVHATTLIDYLSDGLSLADFRRDFPSVSEAEAKAVLAVVRKAIAAGMLTGIEINDEDIV